MGFDESKHPRAKDGKFTDGNGTYDSKDDFATLKKRVQGATSGKDVKSQADSEDKTTIKQQVKASGDKLNGTKVLAVVNGELLTNFHDAAIKLRNTLSKNNGFVFRKDFGEIQVGKRIFNGKKYLERPIEIAAMLSIPTILQKGICIAEHIHHKGREESSATFAGKVVVGDKVGIMAVVVTKTTGNFFKAYRVLTPDGKIFDL